MSLRSIARKLGVSVATISLALRNSPSISLPLQKKIQKAAHQMGYVPNSRLSELMSELRKSQPQCFRGTLAAFSLYPECEPWVKYPHLRRVFNSAAQRAEECGYRLEYFWMKAPGLNPERFRSMVEARGIQGLLCLGSPDMEESLPQCLFPFVLVTFASSIPNQLHRVTSHFSADAHTLFHQLQLRGYSRPGLIILKSGDQRTRYAYSDAFLGAQERMFSSQHPPILKAECWNKNEFKCWFETHRPDVIVLHQSCGYLTRLKNFLDRERILICDDIGLALLDLNPNPDLFSGICQNMELMGITAVEMLMDRLHERDFGLSAHPKTEVVVGSWKEGRTLRVPKTNSAPARSPCSSVVTTKAGNLS